MAGTMKAAVFEGEGRLAIKDMPVPRIQRDDEVLLEVEGCGICGTDVHILDVPPGHPATPGVILGHEYVGRVQEVGPAVANLVPGDRVVIAPNLACGLCTYCRLGRPNQCENFTTLGIYLNGGFARYNVAPERACFKIAPDLPVEEAVFTELLSCVVGGTERVRLQPGESAVVLGAGPVGLMFILAFKAAGAGQIIASDIAPFRLEYARKVGADRVVNPKEEDVIAVVKEATGLGADVVVDSVGSLFDQAVNAACKGGKVVLFGMNQQARPAVSQYDITRNELTIYGTFIGINTFPIAIKMLESGVLKPSVLLSRSVSLAEMPRAIERLRAGQAIKIMVTPR
jgi:(R,R)-butanediol dehydrogenase/meso-butanediol dehydrogenase/diacetyl reductase